MIVGEGAGLPTIGSTSPSPLVTGAARARSELGAQYAAYRRRQAAAFLRLLPTDGVRPLYRKAVEAGAVAIGDEDPLRGLVDYCATLLPLPPYDVWLADLTANPEAHLIDVHESAEAPGVDAPATVESRRFEHRGDTWMAHLRSFRDSAAWRGFIAFEGGLPVRTHRTALIFVEPDPIALRDRFLGFEPATLGAFLRSALP